MTSVIPVTTVTVSVCYGWQPVAAHVQFSDLQIVFAIVINMIDNKSFNRLIKVCTTCDWIWWLSPKKARIIIPKPPKCWTPGVANLLMNQLDTLESLFLSSSTVIASRTSETLRVSVSSEQWIADRVDCNAPRHPQLRENRFQPW